MKKSGNEWIGEIPDSWNVIKGKYCFIQRDGGSWGDEPKGNDDDYICIRIADFDYDKLKIQDKAMESFTKRNYKKEIIQKLSLKKNNILIEKSGGGEKTPVGRTILIKDDINAVYANFMDRLIVNEKIINPNYIQFCLVSFYLNRYVMNYIKQTIGIQNLDITAMLNNEKIPLPTLCEQEKIVDYLNKKLSKIDNIIEKTKETIEDYKKYKESKITHVALTGIEKNKLKESGIDWIGKIPNSWEIKSFKNVMNERNEKNNPIQTEERLSLSIDKGITLYSEKTTNLDRFKDDCSQYKLAHKGDLVFNSMNMIVGATGYSKYFGCVSPVYYTFYDNTNNHITARYYEYVFKTKTVKRVLYSMGKGIMSIDRGDDKINTCRLKISRDDLRTFKVPVPPIEEQNQIVNYLDKKCSEVDNLILNKEKILAELEQYKKSLIYEYVTGKKEVI